MNLPHLRLRYADVAATLALVVALSGTAYAVTALPAGSVGTRQLRADAVTGTKIDAGAVHTSDLAHGAVTSSRVKNDSLSLSDLVGTDITGAISFTLNGGTCALLILGAPGAVAGQVGLVSTTGGDWPTAVSVGAVRTGAGSVSISACNNAGSTVTVTDLGVRVVTFG